MNSNSPPIPKNDALLDTARELRRNMTQQEKRLWYDFLRTYPVKIYKQRIIGNYIADFYCASAKLVIELDGSQHYTSEGKHSDKVRDNFMESLQLKVIRFSNYEIDTKFDSVCAMIEKTIKERIQND